MDTKDQELMEIKLRNFSLAMASCSLLIECIDNTIENTLYETKYKVLARKFQKECVNITNKTFGACLEKGQQIAYEGNEMNIKLLKELFEIIPKLSTDKINEILATIE
jgi:hypothetical protein